MEKYKRIYSHLKSHNFQVFAPNQKTDECKEPYVVVKYMGTTDLSDISSNKALYDVMCYVPKDKYSKLDSFVAEVESAMLELYPEIRPANYKTPSYYNDITKSHMTSIQYLNYQKKER